ncbi:MAG: hypothetical protein IID08_04810 [Candidatus Hydrogenedentes bacterium]|nr:hypothetical protein [Candidatus Hydrogenedentota bacterium]
MEYLYRGINKKRYEETEGKLAPKKSGVQFAAYASAGDPHARCGSGIECGKSVKNTVIGHQWEQKGIPTSGVSSTPHAKKARDYALHNGLYKKGYVVKLSIALLRDKEVQIFRVNELVPSAAIAEPEDDEHVLVAKGFGDIPESAVVDVYSVGNDI